HSAGEPARTVPRRGRIPDADLRYRAAVAHRLPPAGPHGHGVMVPLLQLEGLTRHFGGVTAVDALSLAVDEGELVSIIGPNGAGKTTVFNIVTGLLAPDAGRVRFAGHDITGLAGEQLAPLGFARTFQHGRVFGNL